MNVSINYTDLCFEQIAESCVYGKSFVSDVLSGWNYNNIYVKNCDVAMSHKKLEGFKRLAEQRLYYQKNICAFIRDFFQIQLLDSQAYIMQMAWTTPNVLIVASRAYGKSFWEVLFCMSKQMLSSKPWNCCIASGNSQQSATTFKKLEDIANDRITSLKGSSGYIFKNEVVIPNAAGDGFSHSPSSFSYSLYNSSLCRTVNSNTDGNRGLRFDCVLFDEVGFLSGDMIRVYGAFCAVNESFITGFDENGNEIDAVRLAALPKNIPHQLVYVSSASSTDTEFYRMYRDFSKQMIAGNTNYFVAHIDCELVMSPTIHNVPTAPALSREQIESDMRTNPEKARREYYCQFTSDAGADAIVRRGVITRNEETRKPLLYNDTGDKKFILAYDPARSRDNSVILVLEVYKVTLVDGSEDTRGRIVNVVNLLDVGKKIKSPMQTPDQVEYLKKMILDYNAGADAYGNIVGVYIDAGAGGAGVNIADYLMADWTTSDGIVHRGLIDKEYSADYVKKFPNAVNKIHLMSPAAFKSIMYEAMIELLNQDKISFTASYDNKGYLTVFDINEELLAKERKRIEEKYKKQKLNSVDFEEKVQEELGKIQSVNTKNIKLDWQDELALVNIDALKEEVINMVRKKRDNGKDSFELTPEKANKLNDDRSYTLCLASYALMEERRKAILNKPKKSVTNVMDFFSCRPAHKAGYFN